MTFRELRQLNKYLEASHRAATDPSSTVFITNADKHLAHNLKDLVRAGKDFHATASTTASTMSGGDRPASVAGTDSAEARSQLVPRFPSVRLRHIQEFLACNEVEAPIVAYPDYPEVSGLRHRSENSLSPSTSSFDLEFDKIFSGGFAIIATRAIRDLDFAEAERVLKKALSQHRPSGLIDIDHRRIRIQLVLVNLLQKKGPQIEEAILDLAEVHSHSYDDPTACQLLYALALSHADAKDWHSARRICERLWKALRRVEYFPKPSRHEVLQLLAASYHGLGGPDDLLLALAIEEGFPDVDFREAPPTTAEFILGCDDLLIVLFSLQDASSIPWDIVAKIQVGTNTIKEPELGLDKILLSPVNTVEGSCKPRMSFRGLLNKSTKVAGRLRKRSSRSSTSSWDAVDAPNKRRLLPRMFASMRKGLAHRGCNDSDDDDADGEFANRTFVSSWIYGDCTEPAVKTECMTAFDLSEISYAPVMSTENSSETPSILIPKTRTNPSSIDTTIFELHGTSLTPNEVLNKNINVPKRLFSFRYFEPEILSVPADRTSRVFNALRARPSSPYSPPRSPGRGSLPSSPLLLSKLGSLLWDKRLSSHFHSQDEYKDYRDPAISISEHQNHHQSLNSRSISPNRSAHPHMASDLRIADMSKTMERHMGVAMGNRGSPESNAQDRHWSYVPKAPERLASQHSISELSRRPKIRSFAKHTTTHPRGSKDYYWSGSPVATCSLLYCPQKPISYELHGFYGPTDGQSVLTAAKSQLRFLPNEVDNSIPTA